MNCCGFTATKSQTSNRSKNSKIVYQPTRRQNQQRRLTSIRKDARVQVGRAINRIRSVLRRHNLQHQMPTKTFPTIAAREWVKTIKLPAADRLEMDHAIEDLERSELRVRQLDVAIAKLAEQDQDAQLLMKTAGIAQFSAVALCSPDRRDREIQTTPSVGQLFWLDSRLSQQRRKARPAGPDHQSRKLHGPLGAGPGEQTHSSDRSGDASLAQKAQTKDGEPRSPAWR